MTDRMEEVLRTRSLVRADDQATLIARTVGQLMNDAAPHLNSIGQRINDTEAQAGLTAAGVVRDLDGRPVLLVTLRFEVATPEAVATYVRQFGGRRT